MGARTITARTSPHDEWTRANIGEVVPDRMTPFSYAVWAEPMNRLLALSFRHFGFETDRFQFIRSEDGWLTYNIGVVNHLSERIGLPPMDAAVGTASGPGGPRGRLRWWRLLAHAPGLARSTWGQVLLERRYEEAKVQAQEIAVRYRMLGEQIDDPGRLIGLAHDAYGELEGFLALYADATGAAFSTYVLLERAATYLAPGVSPPSLLRSPGVAVTGVAEAVLLAAQRAGADGHQDVAGESGEEGPLTEFMREFGHRGWQELELANPSWGSDPSALLAVTSTYRAADGLLDRGRVAGAGGSPSTESVPGWRGLVLRAIAARAGEYSAIRENVKHEFYRPIDSIRRLLHKAAAQLCAAGLLESARDMFFLTPDEVSELIGAPGIDALRAVAVQRRARWDGQDAETETDREPEKETGFEPERSRPARLRGIGASPGAAVGTARVLRGPDQAGRLRPGDILVVEALDIGWTPVFGLVGGIVTSIGGVLSHPCTVAREMRVPVVAGVASSQSLIRDGDRLRIDGALGDVELLAPEITGPIEALGRA